MDDHHRRRTLRRYRFFSRIYDTIFWGPNRRLRREALERLELQPGQTVLDVGCGTGLSFQALQDGIGPGGRIIGVEMSPDMLARARQKIADHGWSNVTLIQAAAEEADIPGEVDAVLFHYTHDPMQSEAALRNVLSHLKPGSRVVAAGGKLASRWWQLPANVVALFYWPFVTTTEGATRPWAKLQAHLQWLDITEKWCGTRYIASGTK